MKTRSFLLSISALLVLSCGDDITNTEKPDSGEIKKVAPVLLLPANMACVPTTSELKWTGSAGFTDYEVRVYQGTNDARNPLLSLCTRETTLKMDALPIGPSYCWKVGGRIDNDTVWSALRRFSIMSPMEQWTRCMLKFDLMVVIGIETNKVKVDSGIIRSSTRTVRRTLADSIVFLRTPTHGNTFQVSLSRSIIQGGTIGSEECSIALEFTKDQKLHAIRYSESSSGGRYIHGEYSPYSSSIGYHGSVLDISGDYKNVYRIETPAVFNSNFLPWISASDTYRTGEYVYSNTLSYQGFELRTRPYIILEFQ